MISIVIPVFNEEDNILALYERINKASPMWHEDFEVLLVDDGSTDNTYQMIKELSTKDNRYKLIKFSRNFGHQAAISAGIKNATGDAVVIMDGDLQDPPEELDRFLQKWREGYHVVYAVRRKRKENFFKRLAYKSFYRLLRSISDINIPLDSGDFCVMDRSIVDVLNREITENSRFVRGLRAYAGFRQIGIEYERRERAAGKAKYTFKKLVKLALDGLFDFSTFPLRIASYFGLIVAVPSFLLGVFFIIHRIVDFKIFGYSPADVPGMTTLTTGIFFLGGVILIILGIIGEYLGRIYFEVKRRPFYIVQETYQTGSYKAEKPL